MHYNQGVSMNGLDEYKENKKRYKDFLELMDYNTRQKKHFMPNEIFNDLASLNMKPVHIAFTYSFYYLVSWLYRQGKYGDLEISNKFIKKALNYNPSNKSLDYIIKEEGVLDRANYTHSTKNYSIGVKEVLSDGSPIFMEVEDLSQDERGILYKRVNRNFKAKYPVKHMHRCHEDFESMSLTGVFYDISNTHQVNFDVFSFCMSNKNIGITGFYIYSFLKNKSQSFNNLYQVSYDRLSAETGIPYSTLAKYLDVLRSYEIINGIQSQDYYIEGLKQIDRESNRYIANNSVADFSFTKKSYKKIKSVSIEEYQEIINDKTS